MTARPIWFAEPAIASANARGRDTLLGALGIELTAFGPDWLQGRMPVDARTRQPAGVLHGGASVALAETLASWASTFCVDPAARHCVGLDINANHVRAVSEGSVTGTARPLHLGRATQVWEVRIEDETARLVCIARVTMAVLERPSAYL